MGMYREIDWIRYLFGWKQRWFCRRMGSQVLSRCIDMGSKNRKKWAYQQSVFSSKGLFATILVSLCTVVVLVSCTTHALMTRTAYEEISVGSAISEVEQKYGKPLIMKSYPDGTLRYQYVERLMIGSENVQQNWYVIIVKNGQVIAKQFHSEMPPVYEAYQEPTHE